MSKAASLTNYAKRMNRLRCKIFGEVSHSVNKSSLKVVQIMSEKPNDKKTEVVNYYPDHENVFHLMGMLRKYGLYRDEHEDFRDEMRRLRTLKGKGPKPRNLKK